MSLDISAAGASKQHELNQLMVPQHERANSSSDSSLASTLIKIIAVIGVVFLILAALTMPPDMAAITVVVAIAVGSALFFTADKIVLIFPFGIGNRASPGLVHHDNGRPTQVHVHHHNQQQTQPPRLPGRYEHKGSPHSPPPCTDVKHVGDHRPRLQARLRQDQRGVGNRTAPARRPRENIGIGDTTAPTHPSGGNIGIGDTTAPTHPSGGNIGIGDTTAPTHPPGGNIGIGDTAAPG